MASNENGSTSRKREASESEETNQHNDESSSDSDIGPALPSAANAGPARKKRRTLRHESLYLAALPASPRYSKSLMHKAVLAFVTVTPYTDFLITASVDGQVSFWKKTGAADGGVVDFVKEFKAHTDEITSVSVSSDGQNYASASRDGTIKIWDVESFDLVSTINPEKTPSAICWVSGRYGGGFPQLAIGNEIDGEIEIWDGRGDTKSPIHVIKGMHRKPVVAIAYNNHHDCAISADENGMIEYWTPRDNYEKPEHVFRMKSETNLFDFKKSKSVPTSITVSPTGKQFATMSFPDRRVRVFDFTTGKLVRSYDESVDTTTEMQQAGTAITKLDEVEFGRRLAVEREIENPSIRKRINVIFDESGHFILYGSLYGTKVINTLTNKVLKVYGEEEPFRSLNLALYQGQPDKKGVVTVAMAASDNPLLQEAEARDAMLATTGSGKVRFYLFTNDETISKSTRDVQNEKPQLLNARANKASNKTQAETGSSAILHTTYGDIHVRLFPDAAPKAVENFVRLAKTNYYNGCIFHRVIRKFMIQTGDAEFADGTGGQSIWAKEFEDEFSSLKHDKPYTLSMANAGPNTNGSQFFITTVKTPWLDDKHTIFGRAVQGLDVVHRIENTKVFKEKPEEDIKIVNIDVA